MVCKRSCSLLNGLVSFFVGWFSSVVVVSAVVVESVVVVVKLFVGVGNSAEVVVLESIGLLFDQKRVGIRKKGSAAGLLSSSWLSELVGTVL